MVKSLGTADRQIEVGGTATEDHLPRLLGQGSVPVTSNPLGLPDFGQKLSRTGSPDEPNSCGPGLTPAGVGVAVVAMSSRPG